MLLVKSDLQDDKILKSAVTVASGVTRHLEKVDSRLLGHFSTIPVHGGDSALYMSIAKVIGGSFLDGTGVHSTVRAAMERLPHAITAVFEWSKLNLAPASMHELLLRWDAEHLRTVLASLSFINWRVQHDLEFPLRYVWHEMMRVFCDRMGNVTKISAFRLPHPPEQCLACSCCMRAVFNCKCCGTWDHRMLRTEIVSWPTGYKRSKCSQSTSEAR